MEEHRWLTDEQIELLRGIAEKEDDSLLKATLDNLDAAKALLKECAERLGDFVEYSMGFGCEQEDNLLDRIRAVPGIRKEEWGMDNCMCAACGLAFRPYETEYTYLNKEGRFHNESTCIERLKEQVDGLKQHIEYQAQEIARLCKERTLT